MDCLDEYHREKANKETVVMSVLIEEPSRKLKRKENRRINFKIIILLFLTFLVRGTFSDIIKDNFELCNINDNSPLFSVINTCKAVETEIDNTFEEKNYLILEKSPYHIDGFGFKCTKSQLKITTYESFLGARSSNKEKLDFILSRDECLSITISKMCHTTEMTCEKEDCLSEEEPVVDYAWFDSLVFEKFYCSFTKIPIRGYTEDEKLFEKAKTSCLPKDLYCQVDKSTYIWEKDIIHKCPYKFIKEKSF